ncbi:uncharacterized protein LOC127264055 [Andrographis paniculata]|uniref:uncharacterized protein LOC127264055 n=1 Tax=Andrographis paniculata TaxID=175694 RepID=UPI0021E74AB4|nr:uncharacterized protein LOC127264055 [Andrographis paniculata]
MGNCQCQCEAVDAQAAAAMVIVIQHPNGKQETMNSPVTAAEVMRRNSGHYVSLIIPNHQRTTVRLKLLRPPETLILGRAYRLITTQEVIKVLRAKKNAATLRKHDDDDDDHDVSESDEVLHREGNDNEFNLQDIRKLDGHHRHHQQQQQRSRLKNFRSNSWKPSLLSISEA